MSPAVLLAITLLAQTPAVPPGEVIPSVACAADASQTYSLYLPSGYTTDRAWPVILAFDPGGRGRNPVERYRDAAERFGFIVSGSNNSRNGSSETGAAVTAMAADVQARFAIDARRIYTAGMSGGARVALAVALGTRGIAGVIASSAGYPDAQPHKTLPFPVFATAGTEDFNHVEMRLLDRALTTPHRLVVFEGGHTWLSSDLAVEAVGWMELQAMRSGIAPRNDTEIGELLAARVAAAEAMTDPAAKFQALDAIATDFEGMADVQPIATRAAALGRDKAVRDAIKRGRDEDDHELRLLETIRGSELRLSSEDRLNALNELRAHWKDLHERAIKTADSADRRLARRVLSNLGASITTTDPDYLKVIETYRWNGARR